MHYFFSSLFRFPFFFFFMMLVVARQARLCAELEDWYMLLSRLFLTVTHLEKPLRISDTSSIDHTRHRRLRVCARSQSSALGALKHAVITCTGRLFRQYQKESLPLLLRVEPELLKHIPHIDPARLPQATTNRVMI
eukprot:m.33670 g.33670  ORF g.33670 m.33670 type:complete len:136 (-) comp10915_c0_seq1:275-682(-)